MILTVDSSCTANMLPAYRNVQPLVSVDREDLDAVGANIDHVTQI